MPWLEKKKNWIPGLPAGSVAGRDKKGPKIKLEKAYSITEVSQILSVSRWTVYKWLSIDEPDDAIIPPEAWFKLPSGHIRIFEWIILKLQNKEI